MPKLATPPADRDSVRVSLDELAARLRCKRDKIDALIEDGQFTVICDRPGRQGSPRFVPADEAEYAERHGVAALQAYRKRKAKGRRDKA